MRGRVTVFGFVEVEESVCFDVVDEASAFLIEVFYNVFK